MTSTPVRIDSAPPPSSPAGPRASWHARANALTLAWLVLAAAALVLGDQWGTPRWLPVHLFLLGAVTNAVLTWSEHFTIALLRLAPPPRRWSAVRLVALNTGVAAVIAGALAGLSAVALCGALVVVGVAAWHTVTLVARARARGVLGGRFSHVVRWYVCSGTALVVGGSLGAVMVSATVPPVWALRLESAHVHANLLGWVGLAVLGTLFTLWPTVLRTRMVEGSAVAARRALPPAAAGLTVAVAGLAAGSSWAAATGLALYVAGTVVVLVPLVRTARERRPHTGASWMIAAGLAWFVAALAADLVLVATRPPEEALGSVEPYLPLFLAGFAGQVLLGALTFLLPVVLGGGPAMVKRTTALMEWGWRTRLALVNTAILVTVVPVPPWAVHTAWALVTAALAVFVALSVLATLLSRGHDPKPSPTVLGIALGSVLTAAAVVVAGSGLGASADAPATGASRTVEVTLGAMVIDPGTIEVEPGTALVLEVRNADTQAHDLRFDNGVRTPQLAPGESATLEVGVVSAAMDGWCTLMGHRAAGMEMRVEVAADGGTAGHADQTGAADHTAHDGTGALDLAASMSPGWEPYDAELAPAPGGTEHDVTITATESEQEVAPGVRRQVWGFNGGTPGPVLRGSVGDVFTITFVNDGTIGHGIDFHAGALAPDEPMRTIEPGDSLTYRFRAERAGAWLYHCSTAPMLQHMGNGMYGAVIIDPPDLAPVDREYVLVQGELYPGPPGSEEQVAALRDGAPDAWMFNGTANGYRHAPLTARVGERIRIWAVAAGPTDGTSLHVVGTYFDTVYKEGAYLLRPDGHGAAQALDLAPAQGGFVETTFPEAGSYPFVDHDMRHAENGAGGAFEVTE